MCWLLHTGVNLHLPLNDFTGDRQQTNTASKGQMHLEAVSEQTCIEDLFLPQWSFLPVRHLLCFIQWFSQDVLHEEAEPFLWLPEPFILTALLWRQGIDLQAALLPVNGALLQLMEGEGYKTCGYKTNPTTPPVSVGGDTQQPYHFYILPGTLNPIVADKGWDGIRYIKLLIICLTNAFAGKKSFLPEKEKMFIV